MGLPLVLLDVDGILADFTGGVLRRLNQIYDNFDRPWTLDDVKQWDIVKALGIKHDLAFVGEQGFCAELSILPGAVEGVAELRKLAEVHFVTASWWTSPYWKHERQEWLRKHFGAAFSDVTFTHKKELVRGDIIVDDRPDTIATWSQAWPSRPALLWSAPYNEDEADEKVQRYIDAQLAQQKYVRRIRGWDALISFVELHSMEYGSIRAVSSAR